jgi:hypothetical protein
VFKIARIACWARAINPDHLSTTQGEPHSLSFHIKTNASEEVDSQRSSIQTWRLSPTGAPSLFLIDVILINNDVYNFFLKVLEGCKKLESLHIAGAFQDCETFLKDLSKYIPLATNIRDLRIQAEDISESLLKDLISGIGSCSTLERLMIYHNGIDQHEESLIFLPDCLEDLVHRLPQLVAFCLIYPLDYVTLLDIRHLLSNLNWNSKNNGYVALRPCFWLHIGKHDLPENLSFPRIHIKEFVHPFPYIDPFPVFK